MHRLRRITAQATFKRQGTSGCSAKFNRNKTEETGNNISTGCRSTKIDKHDVQQRRSIDIDLRLGLTRINETLVR
jgi:hypothetical protein